MEFNEKKVEDYDDSTRTTSKFLLKHNYDENPLKLKRKFMIMDDLEGQNKYNI